MSSEFIAAVCKLSTLFYPEADNRILCYHSTTVFVSSLPYETTTTDLITHFSFIGPVKNGFVVKDRVSAGYRLDQSIRHSVLIPVRQLCLFLVYRNLVNRKESDTSHTPR